MKARYAVLSLVLLTVLVVGAAATNDGPFVLRIVDSKGHPIPYLQVKTDSGIVCYTNDKGDVTWSESSLMNRRIRFSIGTPGYRLPDGRVLVVHGRLATVTATTPTT